MAPRFPDITRPKFLFRNPLINYLIKNMNGNLLKKLQKTCKWFFVSQPFTVLDSITNFEKSNEMYNAFFMANKMNGSIFENGNIWVLDSLYISEDTIPPSIVSKIVKCDIQMLVLSIKTTFNELKFLTNAGKITTFGSDNKIYYSDDSLVPIEDILLLVPNASQIMIRYFAFPKETMKKLLNLNHSVKIINLIWLHIEEWIDMDLLYQFLEKFLGQDINPYLSIVFNDRGMNNAFGIEICERIKAWKPEGRIPRNFPYVNKTRTPAPPPSQ